MRSLKVLTICLAMPAGQAFGGVSLGSFLADLHQQLAAYTPPTLPAVNWPPTIPNPPTLPTLPALPAFPTSTWPTTPADLQTIISDYRQQVADYLASLPQPPALTWPLTTTDLQTAIAQYQQHVADHLAGLPHPTLPQPPVVTTSTDLQTAIADYRQQVADHVANLPQTPTPNGADVVQLVQGLYDLANIPHPGAGSPYLMTGGTLMGTGFVGGPFYQLGGIFAPGHSPGTVEFADGYSLQGGVLQIQIQGDGGEPGVDFDFLDVTGAALLDGTLQVSLLDGFEPDGQAFDVLTADNILFGSDFLLDQSALTPWAGHFDLSVVPGGNGEILRLTAVDAPLLGLSAQGSANPEPSTFVLLMAAGASLLGYRWRRRRPAA